MTDNVSLGSAREIAEYLEGRGNIDPYLLQIAVRQGYVPKPILTDTSTEFNSRTWSHDPEPNHNIFAENPGFLEIT